MRLNWMAMLLIAGGPAVFAQQYPQQYPPYQGDPNYNGQYDSGQYAGDPGYAYDGNYDGVYAPAPPPLPRYAYQRPPMPGPGYYWVDGYWNFFGGRYSWIAGYWMLPPYTGGYWVAPRYSGGRYFRGFWNGGRRDFNRGFVRNDNRYQGRGQAFRQTYRAPAQSNRGGDHRENRSNNRGQRGRR